jgi:hypothetical protein
MEAGEEPELNELDAFNARTVLALPLPHPTWRPVDRNLRDLLYGDAKRVHIFYAAKDTYWDMYANGYFAPYTVFLAITLLQRCFLTDKERERSRGEAESHDDGDDDAHLPVGCLWIAIKVTEGQDSGLLASGSVLCWEWAQESAYKLQLPQLLQAEHRALTLLQVDVMAPTTFDLYIACLRLSQLRQDQKEEAYQRGLELLILVEGRAETLSYQPQEVVASMCIVYGVPLPLELRDRVPIDRLTLATQYVDSFGL